MNSCSEFKIQNFIKLFCIVFKQILFPTCVWTCKNKMCLIYLCLNNILLETENVNLRDWIIATLSPQLTVELRMVLVLIAF